MTRGLALAALFLAACGGKQASAALNDAGATGDASADANDAAADAGFDSGKNGLCPNALPGNTTPCDAEGLECEYGTSYRVVCNTVATCTQSAWSLTAPIAADCAGPVNDGSCPATEAQSGTACPEAGLACTYSAGVCECSTATAPKWTCFPSPASASCPFPRPFLGAQCADPTALCTYSTCGSEIECMLGVWRQVGDPCP